MTLGVLGRSFPGRAGHQAGALPTDRLATPELALTPLQMPGLVCWYPVDASVYTHQTGHGSAPPSLLDIGHHRAHVGNSTVTQRPTAQWHTGPNQRPVLRFDGTDDSLSNGTITGLPATEFTQFAVVRNRATGTQRQIAMYIGAAATDGYGIAVRANAGQKGALLGAIEWQDGSEAEGTNWDIYVYQRRSGSSRLWVNGGAPKLTDTTAPNAPSGAIEIGKGATNPNSDIDLAECGLMNGLSNRLADANRLGRYLAWWYGLTWATATDT